MVNLGVADLRYIPFVSRKHSFFFFKN